MTNSYRRAYTEVLEIISHFSESEYSKIPPYKINFYEKNKDNGYLFKINPEVELSQQNISKEAYAIIISLYKDFFASESQIKELNNLLNQNRIKLEKMKKEKYNSDFVFENGRMNVESKNKEELIEYRETFLDKIKNLIKNLFLRKK